MRTHARILASPRTITEGGVPEPVLRVEKKGEIAIVTLDRPQAMNALSRALRGALANAFEELEADPETAAVILTGAGQAFCAGFDLKELESEPAESIGGADMMRSVRSFSGPIIGAVNGHAITGGFELALACDVLIASTAAQFADTHARVGILPGWGLSQILPRLVGIFRAKEISLSGNFISAQQAEAWGLVNRVVPPDELLPACVALATDMLSCNRASLVGYKRLIDAGFGTTFADAMEMEARVSTESAATVTPEDIAGRREAVRGRGRSQTAG
jgi:enoyl-CoA hydratase